MIPNTVLMIRPVRFGFNELTANSNSFQTRIESLSADAIQTIAQTEFDNFVSILKNHGINVIVFSDTEEPFTPDSIFPNNWISTGTKNLLVTYPMMQPNRAAERREDIISFLAKNYKYDVHRELEEFESSQQFLEGTGSLVLDHQNKIAYAAISPRTSETVLDEFEKLTGYSSIRFKAYGKAGELIYHTNVVMTIADEYCVLGAELIDDEEKDFVVSNIKKSGREILFLTKEQTLNSFAGNMLQLQNIEGKKFLVMSLSAYKSLSLPQKDFIEQKHQNKIIAVPLTIIELIGGGSARCMLAEIYS